VDFSDRTVDETYLTQEEFDRLVAEREAIRTSEAVAEAQFFSG